MRRVLRSISAMLLTFSLGLAAHAQGHQEAADLARRCFAGHHDLEGLAGLFEGERLSGRDASDMLFQVSH